MRIFKFVPKKSPLHLHLLKMFSLNQISELQWRFGPGVLGHKRMLPNVKTRGILHLQHAVTSLLIPLGTVRPDQLGQPLTNSKSVGRTCLGKIPTKRPGKSFDPKSSAHRRGTQNAGTDKALAENTELSKQRLTPASFCQGSVLFPLYHPTPNMHML
jgi:hypothetical protein